MRAKIAEGCFYFLGFLAALAALAVQLLFKQ
jgi:hypothetical protein